MSLVLEALRRQQADRDPTAALTLGTEQRRHPGRWPALIVAALLLNAATFAWLFRDRLLGLPMPEMLVDAPAVASERPTGQVPEPELRQLQPGAGASVAVGPSTATDTSTPPGTPPATAQPSAAAPAAAPTVVQAPPPTVLAPTVLERVALGGLPTEVRSRFPGLVISTHVYAEDPALRAIVVNGSRLQEGDQFGGLTIRSIDPEGIVVQFESYLVEVPVFGDW